MIPEISKEKIKTLIETPFLNLYDIQYEEGKHYYISGRRKKDDLTILLSDKEFKKIIPDAVTLCVILRMKDTDRLLLFYEYRYPIGRFVLSPPAGIIDQEDRDKDNAIYLTAVRELFEETGISFTDKDEFRIISPGVFSSPGMTDECNGIALLIINDPDPDILTDAHTVGTELFDGFRLVDKDEALGLIGKGRDERGNLFSVYTWHVLLYFVSGLWN